VVEVSLAHKQVDFLFHALKMAESAYTQTGNWKASKTVSDIHKELHKQIFTYGQARESDGWDE
jgi:hypothetical protein